MTVDEISEAVMLDGGGSTQLYYENFKTGEKHEHIHYETDVPNAAIGYATD